MPGRSRAREPGRPGTDITVTNLGDPINGWNLTWNFTAGQTLTQMWNGAYTQTGAQVRVTDAGYNASLPTNGQAGFGFNGLWTGGNPAPASFTLNGATCTGGTTPSGCTATPVDPNATPQARRLLCYLYSQYGNHILSGQQESTWVGGPDYEVNYIYGNTGKYPAIRGLDMGDSPTFGARAVAWWNAGGIPMVGVSHGLACAVAGRLLRLADERQHQRGAHPRHGRLHPLHPAPRRRSGPAGPGAQAAGAAVLWRPFHEAGGTWFWWSKEGGSQYSRLWRFAFDYYTKTKGLHNLVWLHPYNGSPDASFYPGKAYVDAGGADTYAGDHGPLTSMFSTTRNIVGSTVPIALHENGRIPDPAQLQATGTRWVLFNTWHTTWITDTAVNPVSLLKSVYGSSYVVTRDEVPSLR